MMNQNMFYVLGETDTVKPNKNKLLCTNQLKTNECKFKDKCNYAHSLEEQVKHPIRERIYEMINENDLESIDLHKNKSLYHTLLIHTNLCNKCIYGKCIGGYNCKYGTNSEDTLICYDDLQYGECNVRKCKRHHLTKKGLAPFNKRKYQISVCNLIIEDTDSDSDSERIRQFIHDERLDENAYDSIFKN